LWQSAWRFEAVSEKKWKAVREHKLQGVREDGKWYIASEHQTAVK